VNNSHKIAVLDNGLKYNEYKVSQKELDFVESRRFTRDEIFAIFKVPKSIV
jgi:phage portal protein BeeE